MPDQYGDVIPEDLNALKQWLHSELGSASELFGNLSMRSRMSAVTEAKVLKHANPGSPEERAYGKGAVQVEIPDLMFSADHLIWAAPRRVLPGRFEMPSIGSWVLVTHRAGDPEFPEYFGAAFTDGWFRFDKDNSEPIGFIQSANKGVDKVRNNPKSYRMLESSNGFLFAEDSQAKVLHLLTDDYSINIGTGRTGKIRIGAIDPATDTQGQQTDMEVWVGTSGSLKIKAGDTGTTLTFKEGKITVSENGTDYMVMDLQSKKLTLEFETVEIKQQAGSIMMKGGDVISGVKKTSLEKHVHPTAVPGPPSPPT